MHKLCELESPIIAAGIMSRLEDALIKASVTHSPSAEFRSWKQLQPTIIWLADEKDLPRASEIVEAVMSAPIESDRCPGCGYDLAGHAETGRCPECGREVRPPEDEVACSECGESGPADFETCWNCGAQAPWSPGSAARPRASTSTAMPLADHWRKALFVGLVVFLLGIVLSGINSCS